MNPYHAANKARWEAAAPKWKAMHDRRGHWQRCHREPELAFYPQELPFLKDVKDKKVAVLGSGDNLAVFALAGMGARVTSVDLSENQLAIAHERAEILDLDITFLQADVMDLSALGNDSFNLVYTGGHVAVWVSDLEQYYREAVRILKPGGRFLVNEYHPFRRIWKEGTDHLEVGYDYSDRGPFQFEFNDDILEPAEGAYPQYEFHWRISDFIRALLGAGCRLIHCEEMGAHVGDWEGPVEGLPEMFFLVGIKKG